MAVPDETRGKESRPENGRIEDNRPEGGGPEDNGNSDLPARQLTPRARRRRFGRLGIAFIEVIAETVAGLVFVLIVLAARLVAGPVELDSLAPYAEIALAAQIPPFTVHVATTELHWSAGQPTFEVEARDVRAVEPGGKTVFSLPLVTMTFSFHALVSGILAPVRVVAEAPYLRLERRTDGSFSFIADDAPPNPAPTPTADAASGDSENAMGTADLLFRDMLAAPDPSHSTGFLTEVSIQAGRLTVEDRQRGIDWLATGVNLAMSRGAAGMTVDGGMDLDLGGGTTHLSAHADYDRFERYIAGQVDVAGVEPELLAPSLPAQLQGVRALKLPISGNIILGFDLAKRRLDRLALDFRGGVGRVDDSHLGKGTVPVTQAHLAAQYDAAKARLSLDTLSADFDGPKLTISGVLNHLDADLLASNPPPPPLTPLATEPLPLDLTFSVTGLPTDRIGDFWPPNLVDGARRWVTENITGSAEQSVSGKLSMALDQDAPDRSTVTGLSGHMTLGGLTIDYLHGLPKLDHVSGSATFDQRRMDFTVNSGSVKAISVPAGSVSITDLDNDIQTIAIEVTTTGPLRDLLEALDAKRLQLIHKVGLNPSVITGSAIGTSSFRFPLIAALKIEQVAYASSARLTDLSIPKVALDRDLTTGNFSLTLDPQTVRLDGDARLAGVPVTLSVAEYLEHGPLRSEYRVRGRFNAADRHALGFDLAEPYVSGPLGTDVTYRVFDPHRSEATMLLDLAEARLHVDEAAWSKPSGTPGTASGTFDLVDQKIVQLRDIKVASTELQLAGRVGFSDTDVVQQAQFDKLYIGGTDLAGSVERQPQGGWRVDVAGTKADISGLLATTPETAPGVSQATAPLPPLIINAKIDRVTLGPDRAIRDVGFVADREGGVWQAVSLDGLLNEDARLGYRLERPADGGRFTLTTDDFGALLRVLDVTPNVIGGRLAVNGTTTEAPGRRRYVGAAEGHDYRLINAPFFARLLSLASFASFGSLLSGEGIPFTTLKADFTFDNDRLTIAHGRAYGGAIGINVDGPIDLGAGTLDLAGTLVPAYAINRILGDVPLLGDLLVGGEGQGVFAGRFRMAGPIDDPRITVNPLSALAPGFLRNLFLFDAPNPVSPGDGAK
ncbi:MAG TPA: DUF3971 domain-containing protein [Stellaceae bacterium]|nr:DUF3971 domain-containing protein [Stellaceae bacterium]